MDIWHKDKRGLPLPAYRARMALLLSHLNLSCDKLPGVNGARGLMRCYCR
jgi:hypothetical protein